MEQFKGKFLQGKPQKLKKSKKSNSASYSNTISTSTFKPNGRVLPKKGAV
jgi:hypothetical protein